MYYIFLLVPTAYSVTLGCNGFPPLFSFFIYVLTVTFIRYTTYQRSGTQLQTTGYS